jgi:hypothetical protein
MRASIDGGASGAQGLYHGMVTCLLHLSLFARRHRVDFIIKWPCIADVKYTGSSPTAQCVWNMWREINISVTAQRGGGPIFGNIGKVPLNPDIELVTGMAMIGKRIMGWEVD